MRVLIGLMFIVAALLVAPMAAQAKVKVSVDLSSQRMVVQSDSGASYTWQISSARAGYVTPRGTYHPTSLQTMHRSKKYHNSPMPHSIFFNGGYAIHGTSAVRALGRPASHGCIRLSPAHAATLFSLVRQEGAVIQIHGNAPVRRYAQARHKKHVQYAHRAHPRALSYAPAPEQKVRNIFGAIFRE